MSFVYTKTIVADVNGPVLYGEIEASITGFDGWNRDGSSYDFLKLSAWSAAHQSTVDTIITNHSAVPPPGGENVVYSTAVVIADPGAGSDEIMIMAPDPVTSPYTITLPPAVGTAGQILETSNASGALTWTSPTVFGSDFAYVQSLSESTTTSSTFQNKLSYTSTALTGTYRIGWSSVIAQQNTQDSVEARLYNETDNVTIGSINIREEPQDNDNYMFAGGFGYVIMTGTSKTFRIQYREQDGGTAKIAAAMIEWWRVA